MESIKSLLRQHDQISLLDKDLSPSLVNELKALNWEKVDEAISLLKVRNKQASSFEPITLTLQPAMRHPAPFLKGHTLGCLVMAGGQATRCNGSLPKGLIAVSRHTHKSTLQMIAEKVRACSSCYGKTCYLGIMTSEATHDTIVQFFSSHQHFGLDTKQVFFFKQSSLPALDEKGQLIIKNNALFMVPDGNGGIFRAFYSLMPIWEKAGVSFLSIINSDNPLIDPFLPNLFEPLLQGAEMTAAAVERISPEESVGLFVQQKDKVTVIEYSEMEKERSQDLQRTLSLKWANISFLACTLQTAKKAASHKLPLHLAKKTLHDLSFWKAEHFIFDHFPLISSFKVVPISREFFAPIKTLSGPFSPEGVGLALEERDKKRFFELYHRAPPSHYEFPEQEYYGRL